MCVCACVKHRLNWRSPLSHNYFLMKLISARKISKNKLTILPEGVFQGLTDLQYLWVKVEVEGVLALLVSRAKLFSISKRSGRAHLLSGRLHTERLPHHRCPLFQVIFYNVVVVNWKSRRTILECIKVKRGAVVPFSLRTIFFPSRPPPLRERVFKGVRFGLGLRRINLLTVNGGALQT